jgi:hypothetical protein
MNRHILFAQALQPQVFRAVGEVELYLTLIITCSGGV